MKVLVVDDEKLARDRLVRLCAELDEVDQVVEAANGQQALELIQSAELDLVLLDIQMPGADGLEVAEQINKIDPAPAIIFCTAFDQYALKAIERKASAYLLKPVRRDELSKAITNARHSSRLQIQSLSQESGRRQHLPSESSRTVELIPVEDIRCLVADHKSVKAYLPSRDIWVGEPLKKIADEFPQRFLRIHRNALVALEHITGLHQGDNGQTQVLLDSVDVQPSVSRRHLSEVKQRLKTL